MTTRRNFLAKSALAVAGTALVKMPLFATPAAKSITGIQLYSVRDRMTKDPAGTLKALADMGYVYVEHANYVDGKLYGYSPAEFRKLLDSLGLQMKSGHTVMRKDHWDSAKKDFSDSWKKTVEDAALLGQSYVISPWLDEAIWKDRSLLSEYMDVFNKSGELCKKSGMKFGYHNHNFEFKPLADGSILYDIILKNTDPSLVIHQLDIGNMYSGGGRAMDVLKRYPGRFESMHVKDEIANPASEEKFESTILGKGIIGTHAVVDYGKKHGGTKHFIIEQESYQGMDPLDCSKADLDIMRGWGY